MSSAPHKIAAPHAATRAGCDAPPGNAADRAAIPELLAPAGDWECARAAVENGADAIYFGLEKFNARMRAHNFTESDLPPLMTYLHQRGVKGYVTFNTLIFENELPQAEAYVRTIIAAGVDAAIVQDVGICRMIRQISPDFPIHASTQMTITSANGVEFARELGCNLVVLARECSLKEIERIQKAQFESAVEPTALPLEVFVHGALCVAYSGQCLTSEAMGGRSANRGECAQACRLPYDLISDGVQVPLGDRKYLLSPQDLAGLDLLPEIVRSGVASLKIEGRLKTPEYVANITRIYRKALDQSAPTAAEKQVTPTEREHYEMEMAFSRGIYTGWFEGVNNQKLVHANFGKKRGVYLGEVTRVLADSVLVQIESQLKPGDGVVFDAGRPEENEQGGRVYEIRESSPPRQQFNRPDVSAARAAKVGREVRLAFGHGAIDFSKVQVGDRLWKTSDPELERELRKTFDSELPRFQRPVQMEVHGELGKPLTLLAHDHEGHVVRSVSSMNLAQAERQPLTAERLCDQLGRLGGTPFRLGELKNYLAENVMLPVSELNRLRREAVEQLQQLRSKPLRWTFSSAARPSLTLRKESAQAGIQPELIVLVRNQDQLEVALKSGIKLIYCELEDPKIYAEAVTSFRDSAHRLPDAAIFVAPPRIFKMGEEWTLKLVRASKADGYLIRNYDHLKYFGSERRVGDFSLNIANHFTAEYFKNHFGLERLTASYDLNSAQLEALFKGAPADWFEVTIHQHMPMFHMEHCVFCAFLSQGTDYTNCGRPCDKHDLKLRDRMGAEHPVKADAGCRNTVFQAAAQTGAEHVAALISMGARHFRIEFVNETAEQTSQTISKYQQLLKGEMSGAKLWRELKLVSQLGVTRGPKRA